MTYTVAVRALCEFTAREGDLDLRFTPAPTAQEGMAGHLLVGARRDDNYQREVSLEGSYRELLVRGRADGYDPAINRLEEIKTYRGDLRRMPDNQRRLHWAQARIYGWLLCQKLQLPSIQLALVYFDIGSQQETILTEDTQASSLHTYFEQQCERFLAWAQQEMAHRTARDAALSGLAFPHPAFRTGQRELAGAVYKGLAQNRCVMAQAPTGIGKTVGTLFPALKACAPQALDKVFYLAAKTAGRGLALDALDTIARDTPALPLRVLELVARDKACEHPDKACHGTSCPLAQGFYDRLPAARAAAVSRPLHQAGLREVALEHAVCPYYLSQDLVRWADVVVGDYNYYFDASAMLYSLTVANQWRVSVLVDEAHNLLERGRAMYSAQLDQRSLATVRASAPASLNKPLDRIHRRWNALHKEQADSYQVHAAVPAAFVTALQQAATAIADHLAEHPSVVDDNLQRFYFDMLHFIRLLDTWGEHAMFDVTREHGGSLLCIRNVIPAPYLAPRFAAARSVTLFSATLGPWHFYADTLGVPENAPCIDVASPFEATQLTVHLVRGISTRFQHRDESLAPIAALLAQQFAAQPGNYLAFFSSFDYLQKACDVFTARHPDIPVWQQSRQMDESARDAFLARFAAGGRGIGFAVLGGVFAEGIDLPGERLIGAFIATLGLPQLNPVNEQMRRRMEAAFGNGYDYTYLYPGLRKVVQAAGRVIRDRADRGTVYLIDDRFAQPAVRALLPAWWDVET